MFACNCNEPAQALRPDVYGCPWNADSLGNLQIGKTVGRKVSYRFRATVSKELEGVRVFLMFRPDVREYGRGDGGQVRIELRDDDGTDAHHPAGNILATSLVTDPKKNAQEPDRWVAYRLFRFDNPARMVAGKLYHLVFSNPAPDPVNHYVSINDLYSNVRQAGVQPGISDTDLAVIYKYAAKDPWAINYAHTPIFCLYYAGGAHDGPGYINGRSQSLLCKIAGPKQVRQIFTISGGNRVVTQVSVRLRKVGKPEPLILRLETGGKLIEAIEIPTASVAEEQNWHTWHFKEPCLLKNGASYALVLRAAEGDAYEIYPLTEGTHNGFHGPMLFTDGHFEHAGVDGRWQDEHGREDMQFYFTVIPSPR